MNVIRTQSYEESAKVTANLLLEELAKKPDLLMGLATGSSAEGVYAEMVSACRAGTADFSRARTVNLDEYVGGDEAHSYRKFMDGHLFSHVGLPQENITIADRTADPGAEVARLRAFFKQNRVDIQLLGLGPNGHIGFNEPADTLCPDVHAETLTEATIAANARFFDKAEDVPRQAITMGMGDILRARRIVMIVTGESKREALKQLLEGSVVTTQNPGTFLLLHGDVTVVTEL